MDVSKRPVRGGFTLVELLIVILIIAILAAMLLTGLTAAQTKARNFAISTELEGMSNGLESFKGDYGDYPPDFEELDPNRVFPNGGPSFTKTHASRFIRKNFPRIGGADLTAIAVRAPSIDNAEVLVLWLRGVSKNPAAPFTGPGGPLNTSDKRQSRFDFDPNRFGDRDNDGFLEYYPPGKDIALSVPYCYFNSNNYSFTFIDSNNARQYGYAEHQTANLWVFDSTQNPPIVPVVQTDMGVARPLRSVEAILATNQDPSDSHPAKGFYFEEKEKFQIISGGLDGLFGQGVGFYPTGLPWPTATNGYLLEDQDNLTNFSEGKTLKQAIP